MEWYSKKTDENDILTIKVNSKASVIKFTNYTKALYESLDSFE